MSSATTDDGPVEIRVHGIGHSRPWTSYGRTRVLNGSPPGMPELLEPARPPRHRVLLVSWSRVSRRGSRVAWYLAFPYTLINMADAMAPERGRAARAVQTIAVNGTSVVLTVLTALWVAATAERAALRLGLERVLGIDGIVACVAVGALALAALMLVPLRGRAARRRPWPAVLHAALALATAAATLVAAPARLRIDPDGWWRLHASWGVDDPAQIDRALVESAALDAPVRVDLVAHLDPLGAATFAGMGAVLVLVAALLLTMPRAWTPGTSAPLAGTALALGLSSILTMLALPALLRLIPETVLAVAGRLPTVAPGASLPTGPAWCRSAAPAS